MRREFGLGLLLSLSLLSCKSLDKSEAFRPFHDNDEALGEAAQQKADRRKEPVQDRFPRPWRIWVDPEAPAAKAAAEQNPDRGDEARLLSYLAEQPVAVWYRGESSSFAPRLQRQLSGAKEQDAFALMVLDNIPYGDCKATPRQANAAASYKAWIAAFTQAIGEGKAIVVLEPEGVSRLDCLPPELQAERLDLLKEAILELKKGPNTLVYLDAGGPGILKSEEAGRRLNEAGVAAADGTALNTAQYQKIEAVLRYGLLLRRFLGPKNFIIDTSHNGKGPPREEKPCNPSGVGVGEAPFQVPDDEVIDSYLWLKMPGISDGPCGRGEPAEGQFFKARAIQMARAAGI